MSVFETLNKINVNEHVEKKNGLSYLSWAWAWAEVKKKYPTATFTIYENEKGWNYFTDGQTCWVKTGVTIGGLEHIEYLPVMDFRNKSFPADKVTSFDVNKAIQRSLTKACARHGLGLYIYAGEDLPEEQTESKDSPKSEQRESPKNKPTENQIVQINNLLVELNIDLKDFCKKNKLKSLDDLTQERAGKCIDYLKKQVSKNG